MSTSRRVAAAGALSGALLGFAAAPSWAATLPHPHRAGAAQVPTPGAASGELSCLPDPVLQALFGGAGMPDPAGEHPVGDAVSQAYGVEDQVPLPAGAPDPARTAGGELDCAEPYVQPPAPPTSMPPDLSWEQPSTTPSGSATGAGGGRRGPAVLPDLSSRVDQPPQAAPVAVVPPMVANLSGATHAAPRLRSSGVGILLALLVAVAAGAAGVRRLLLAPLFVVAGEQH